jgi:hypothetical protein
MPGAALTLGADVTLSHAFLSAANGTTCSAGDIPGAVVASQDKPTDANHPTGCQID